MASTTRRCFSCGHGTEPEPESGGRRAAAIVGVVASIVAVVAALTALYMWRSSGDGETTDVVAGEGDQVGAVVVIESATDTTGSVEDVISVAAPTTVAAPATSAAATTTSTTSTTTPTTTTTSTTTTTTTVPTITAPPPPTTPPPTVAPIAAPPVPSTTVPGDLVLAGHQMFRPECDGAFIVSVGSFPPDAPEQIRTALEQFPGTNYLRTDQTCASLRADFPDGAGSWAGKPIYMVVFGPYPSLGDACSQQSLARVEQPDAYTKVLDPTTEITAPNPCS